ncbi:MAG TPA: hypothetical protein VIC81_01570 [Acidimicrobiales bacterium]
MSDIRGTVVDFEERRGDGWLTSDQGESLYFHCVEIADGTRSILVGARVRARRGPGRRGVDEAYAIVPED